jgi:FAD/FMN-containing dehydrogenase
LLAIDSPLVVCASAQGAGADYLFKRLKNPYYLGDEPSLTQTLGWIGGWTSQPSTMAVAAESPADVAAAVRFARDHQIRLVVKGGGHSYFGNSNAANSLLLWTRRLNRIELHDDFRPQGAPVSAGRTQAVSVGSGAIWGRVYDAVATKGGRYVQGGGCLTVGVTGFVLGGGFGSLSKTFGSGAANLLEAEIVTADSRVRVVNAYQEPDLFYALKGGGGGTFGIVTRLTLKTHPLPANLGAALFSVSALSDEAWRALVARTVDFYAKDLFGPLWGEQLRFGARRRLGISMVAHDLDQASVEAVWRPFLSWIESRPQDYRFEGSPILLSIPGSKFWDPAFLRTLPGIVLPDDRPGAPADNVFWATNLGEAGQVINAYQSKWVPAALLQKPRRAELVDAIVAASAEWSVSLHTNKGLAGGTAAALAASQETATNPAVLDAFALLICAADAAPAWPGIPGREPDVATAHEEAAAVSRAMAPFHRLVPEPASYMSEANYFEREWKQAYWGANYQRLAEIKQRYDPSNFFKGHQLVEPD